MKIDRHIQKQKENDGNRWKYMVVDRYKWKQIKIGRNR